MSRHDSYYQFPLCALAFGETVEERLQHIISWSVLESGQKIWSKKGNDGGESMVSGFLSTNGGPEDFDENDELHKRAMAGYVTNRQHHPSIKAIIRQHAALDEFRRKFELRHGRDASVRVRTDIMLSALSGKLKYITFCVFVAILSDLGDKAYKRVTKETIQPRMMGYKSNKVMKAELSNRTDGAAPLRLSKISYQVTKAIPRRRLLARARKNERQTYYSVRMSQSQLRTEMVKLAGRSSDAERIESDAALMALCKSARAERLLAGNKPLNTHDSAWEDRNNSSQMASLESSQKCSL